MSSTKNKWLLPDGVEELLPDQAWRVEQCRRRVLDEFSANGYQLVQPPLLEFIDSLLTGAGHDLDLLTFKVTDQHTGRMMGVRADMTPQLSRIDAHVLNSDAPSRLCYVGPVLQTAHRSGFHSREPIQFGAEIFGHSEIQSDVEIIRLCAAVLTKLGIEGFRFDLGHVGIFNALVSQARLSTQQTSELLDICQRKSWPDMTDFITKQQLPDHLANLFRGMLELEGPAEEVFTKAQQLFEHSHGTISEQLNEFRALVELVQTYLPDLVVSVDFLELRGINYHTGAVFSVYCDQYANALAKGGRYDDVGLAFGRARSATGFSADLRQAIQFADYQAESASRVIYAPFVCDQQLHQFIDGLRTAGEQVVVGFDNEEINLDSRQIINHQGRWIIKGESE